MTAKEAITKIRNVRKSFRTSLIKLESMNEWKVYEWYEVIKFQYKEKEYEYRSTASEAWIEEIN